ncbi:MAG: BMP family ABC transporter substrate-binding protein, partial [Lachnospiraceae bacterium]
SENKMDAGEIKVGVLYLGDPAEGAGYTYTHELGIEGMQNNLGLEESQIIRKINIDDADETATKQALQECVDEGCNIIFSTSWGYMQATSDFAEKYPDIYFSHATGYMSNGKNFNNYFGRIYQARYLSGIVAGKNTKTNKLGYVAAQGLDNSEVTGGINAFAMGAASVNPDVKVYVKVTGSWYAPEAEEAAARKLLDAGCDVIAQHCDAASLQKIAQDKGAYSIGYNSDMSKEAPKACLCSVIWNWSAYYTYAVQSVLDGTWDGANYFGGLEEGLVDITEPADFCADGTKEAVEQVKSEILAGENHVFEGELETNTGETIGKKGEVFSDEDITGKMSWYYKNVKVLN